MRRETEVFAFQTGKTISNGRLKSAASLNIHRDSLGIFRLTGLESDNGVTELQLLHPVLHVTRKAFNLRVINGHSSNAYRRVHLRQEDSQFFQRSVDNDVFWEMRRYLNHALHGYTPFAWDLSTFGRILSHEGLDTSGNDAQTTVIVVGEDVLPSDTERSVRDIDEP